MRSVVGPEGIFDFTLSDGYITILDKKVSSLWTVPFFFFLEVSLLLSR
jgi:hypothetical protein